MSEEIKLIHSLAELIRLRRDLKAYVAQIEATMAKEGDEAIMPVQAGMLLARMQAFLDLVEEKLSDGH